MAQTVQVGDRTFTVRRQTFRALLDQEGTLDALRDAEDRMEAIQKRIAHAGRQLDALAEVEGDFDSTTEATLLARRKELREQERAVQAELIRAQMRAVAMRLDPAPDPDDLLDSLDPSQLGEILGVLSEDPTNHPSAQSAGGS